MAKYFIGNKNSRRDIQAVPPQALAEQLDYILKFITLVVQYDQTFEYFSPDQNVKDLGRFISKFKLIKKEFARLNPAVFQHGLTEDLFSCIKSSHEFFTKMLINGDRISECIQKYNRTRDIEELSCLHAGVIKGVKQSGKMCKLLKRIDRIYSRLNKKVNKLCKERVVI